MQIEYAKYRRGRLDYLDNFSKDTTEAELSSTSRGCKMGIEGKGQWYITNECITRPFSHKEYHKILRHLVDKKIVRFHLLS